MNKRICDLAQQAGFEITPWRNELLPCVHQEGPIHIQLEKFAQLIAQDCAELLDISRLNTPSDQWGFVARIWTLQEAAKIIRNHFGVSK